MKKIQELLKKFWQHYFVGRGKDETEFLPAVLEVTETPPSPVGRLVMWTIVVLLVIGFLWSIFGYVDEVAIAKGKLIPSGQIKQVQAEDKGIIKAIYVKEGQQVKKGDLLVELDQTVSAADLAKIRKQIAYYNLEIERCLAEQDQRIFNPKVTENVDSKDLEVQQTLYRSRTWEQQTKRAAAIAGINQSKAAIESGLANQRKISSQLAIARDKEQRLQSLVADNAVALFQLFELQSARLGLEGDLAAQEADIARLEAALAQSEQNLASITAEYERDIATKVVDDRKEMTKYMEELKKAEQTNSFAQILAPVDGHINQLGIHTVGGIVTAAQLLMTIVPEDADIEIEAWAENKDIGFIQVGQTAEIKISTFNFQKYGVIEAIVKDISPDAQDEQNNQNKNKDNSQEQKYRLILVADKSNVLVSDRQVPLTPGMSVTAEIKIKQKRVIEFFLDPFRKYQNESLRER